MHRPCLVNNRGVYSCKKKSATWKNSGTDRPRVKQPATVNHYMPRFSGTRGIKLPNYFRILKKRESVSFWQHYCLG